MNRSVKQYLGLTFLITYLCFGALIFSGASLDTLSQMPLYLLLFVLGCLGSFFAALLVYLRDPEKEGVQGLKRDFSTITNKTGSWLTGLFFILHFLLSFVLGAVRFTGGVSRFILYLPLMLLLFGSQEVGWRVIVQPGLLKNRRYWKATTATGLLQAVWFLPLFFLPGFPIHPDYFLHFAVGMVGFAFLQATLYQKTGGALCNVLFSTMFFAALGVASFKQSSILFVIAGLDIVVASMYASKRFR